MGSYGLALLLALLMGSLMVPALGSGGAIAVSIPHPKLHVVPSDSYSTPSGNFSLALPGPIGSAPVGSVLHVRYRVAVPAYPTGTPALTVRVPGVVAIFQTTAGQAKVAEVAKNITVTGPGASSNLSNEVNLTLVNATTFVSQAPAILTSQLVALMLPVPFRSAAVVVQWQWEFVFPDHTVASSNWGPSLANATIYPAQTAALDSTSGKTVAAGASFSVCLNDQFGPLAGRSFSLHALIPAPLNDFARANITLPGPEQALYCWGILIPTSVSPQPILIHVWSDVPANVTTPAMSFLIFVLKVTVTSGNSSSGLVIPVSMMGLDLLVVGAIVACVVAGVVLARRSRKRASPAAWAPTTTSALAPSPPSGEMAPTVGKDP